MEEIHKALHEALLDGGPKQVAHLMGVSHTGLLNRANPNDDTHRLHFDQVLQIIWHTKDARPVAAMAALLGFDLVSREEVEAIPVQGALNEVVAEFGDVARTVHDAMADNHLSALERRQIVKQAQELIDAAQCLIASAKRA
ncbi:phage regulatory CII family protein [Pseudomonas sp. TMP25]|uniref:phage regulatory CII family protein n=1 Tax=Pseudomonas sp. TMP25 TaxID=3136561 RepID=UPI00310142FD